MSASQRPCRLAVLITHPIQYFRPVFAELAADPELELLVLFGCDHGQRQSMDPDFRVAFAWDSDLTEGFPHLFMSQRPLADLSRWSVAWPLAWAAREHLRSFRPDRVLVFAYTPAWITAVTLLLRLSGQRLFLRADGTDRAFQRSRLKSLFKDLLLQRWYRQFDHIFPIGSDSLDHFRRLGVKPHALTPVRYSVDVDFFADQVRTWMPQRSALRLEQGFSGQELVLLWSAKMTAVKHPALLLEALMLLPESLRSRFCLLAVGDGPLRQRFEVQAGEILPGRCRFLGFQNQRSLGACYATADALVFPSRQGETWGLVVNEALQFGCAVITSDHAGSARDLVAAPAPSPPGSAVFASNDAAAMAEALSRFAALHPRGFTPKPIRGLPHPRDLAQAVSAVLKASCRA